MIISCKISLKSLLSCLVYNKSYHFNKPGDWFSIKMLPHQCRDSHYKNRSLSWLFNLYNENPYSWKDSLYLKHWMDGLVQDCSISIANALEILQSCTKPSESVDESDDNITHENKAWYKLYAYVIDCTILVCGIDLFSFLKWPDISSKYRKWLDSCCPCQQCRKGMITMHSLTSLWKKSCWGCFKDQLARANST